MIAYGNAPNMIGRRHRRSVLSFRRSPTAPVPHRSWRGAPQRGGASTRRSRIHDTQQPAHTRLVSPARGRWRSHPRGTPVRASVANSGGCGNGGAGGDHGVFSPPTVGCREPCPGHYPFVVRGDPGGADADRHPLSPPAAPKRTEWGSRPVGVGSGDGAACRGRAGSS